MSDDAQPYMQRVVERENLSKAQDRVTLACGHRQLARPSFFSGRKLSGFVQCLTCKEAAQAAAREASKE